MWYRLFVVVTFLFVSIAASGEDGLGKERLSSRDLLSLIKDVPESLCPASAEIGELRPMCC